MAVKSASINDTLTSIPGIGPASSEKFERLGLVTVHDLLHHYPSRYLDYTKHVTISQLTEKKDVSFMATISQPKRFVSRTGKLIIQATASDYTGKIKLTWFNTPYVERLIEVGEKYLIAGKTSMWNDQLTLVSPVLEKDGTNSLHTKGLVPIYPQTAKLTSRFIRQKIKISLDIVKPIDPLPREIIENNNLYTYNESLNQIHFPKTLDKLQKADERLAFNHHLAINLNNQIELKKLPLSSELKINHTLDKQITNQLPFKLTSGQKRAIKDGYSDLSKSEYTHRLIQGETGSGKTVVIFFLANQALSNNMSFVLMAPTEILAIQHYESFSKLGLSKNNLMLVTGKNKLHENQNPTIYIGTHALLNQLSSKTTFPIAAIAIDEQHKFGVEQRQSLIHRDPAPHLFNLTATPIPRTIALGLFGEVSVTTIGSKPKNRLPIKTWVTSPSHFEKGDNWLSQQLENGSKIFVVTPLIHNSEKLKAESAEKIYEKYQKKFGNKTDIYLIHGQMKPDEIDKTLNQFKSKKGGIMVGTSIIEVGVDIPEADIIIIHSAERFGLASLHQLRGRVGRGERQSYCLLIPTTDEQEQTERLQLLEKYHSAIKLAKMDLKLRGSGELFGTRQHGWLPVRLKSFWSKESFVKAKAVAKEIVAENIDMAATIANRLVSW